MLERQTHCCNKKYPGSNLKYRVSTKIMLAVFPLLVIYREANSNFYKP